MICKHYKNNQCHLILEWQPKRYITEIFCQRYCKQRYEWIIEWAKAKQKKQKSLKKELTVEQKYIEICNNECNQCKPKNFCAHKQLKTCKRGKPGYFCKEDKWPEPPWGKAEGMPI